MSPIEIREHAPGTNLSDFLAVARVVYAGDSTYVAPLTLMLKDQLSPKSPFYEHADVAFFTARRGGELVGRISAQIDREHLRRYGDQLGFFGFFDTIDDADVASALFEAACQWLKQRGMARVRGPMNLSVSQEIGLLVDGFDTPPMVMMPHGRPYMDGLMARVGLTKEKDLYAWRWDIGPDMPKRCIKAHADMREAGVKFRSVNLKTEIPELVRIQDDAWSENWAHVSMTPREAKQLAEELKLILDPTIAIVAEVEGQLAGMAIAVPNLNEAIRDFDGGIGPARLLKLLYRLKIEHPKSARVALLGIRQAVRKQKKYAPLALAMIAELNRRGYQRGYQWAELSWTVEDNGPVNALIKMAGGSVYKTYRVYDKSL